MAHTARYAWWLLIFLFSLIILGNAVLFLSLSRYSPHKGFQSGSPEVAIEIQVQYALMVSQLGVNPKLVLEPMLSSLEEKQDSPLMWEVLLRKAILEAVFQEGDVRATLAELMESPSERFDAVQRRWYSALWQSVLVRELPAEEIPLWIEALRPTTSRLFLRLVEAYLYERAGEAERAKAIRSELAQEAIARFVPFMLVLLLGGGLLFTGIGALLFYLLLRHQYPLPKRPYENASPFALDPLLWALVAFLLLVVSGTGRILNEMLESLGIEVPYPFLLPYLTAIAISLGLLYAFNQRLEGIGSVRWFAPTSIIRQIGVSIAGYSAFIPLAVLSLSCLVLVNPALPSEQTNPIFDSPPQSRLDLLVSFLLAVVCAPIIEEFLFRGVLFQVLWQRTGRMWLSACVSGFLFAVIHPQFLAGIVPVFLLGVILAVVYAHTRSLLPCILMHAYNNGLITLLFWSIMGG